MISPRSAYTLGQQPQESEHANCSAHYRLRSDTERDSRESIKCKDAQKTLLPGARNAHSPRFLTPAGLRHRITTTRENLWRGGPLKALTVRLPKSGGRNFTGHITAWHRGGGAKKMYRMIDFKRRDSSLAGTVERLEYDPNRSARIALVRHQRGEH